MFAREELLASAAQLLESPCPPLGVVAFGQHEFEPPSTEQEIIIHRGQRADFDSALLFWIKSIQSREWQGRERFLLPYLCSGKCQQISEREFNAIVDNYTAGLKKPIPLPLHPSGGFIAALEMYDGWDDVGAIAEFEDEYVAFAWDTTA